MARNEDNTVSSKNQVKISDSVYFEDRGGKKILFLGNSITKHAPSPTIGWYGDWGMAASTMENDYVHLTVAKVWELKPDTSFMVTQIALWEREFWNEDLLKEKFPDAVNYNADIIVMRAIENIREIEHEGYSLEKAYNVLIDTVAKNNAKVVLTNSFWQAPKKEPIVEKVAKDRKCKLVDVCIGADDRYTAKGLFEHSGVAAHPGDDGMKEIACRIFEGIKEYL